MVNDVFSSCGSFVKLCPCHWSRSEENCRGFRVMGFVSVGEGVARGVLLCLVTLEGSNDGVVGRTNDAGWEFREDI